MKKRIFIVLIIIILQVFKQLSASVNKPTADSNLLNESQDLIKSERTRSYSAEQITPTPRPGACFLFALDTVIAPGIQIGAGSVKYDSTSVTEKIFLLHSNIFRGVTIGISGKFNKFKSLDRTGVFTTFNMGIDYLITPVGSSGDWDTEGRVLPNISCGVGYSFDMGNHSFLRVSLDIGIKYVISNLTVSVIF